MVEKLGELVCQTYHNVGGGPIEFCGGKMGTLSLNESTKQCHVCSKVSTFVSMCKDHFICQQCFEDHVYTHLGDETIYCPINGCDKTFSNEDLSYLYKLHVKKRDENDKWSKLLQDQKEILKQIQEGNKEILEKITDGASQLPRLARALANLTAGLDARCPRIVCIVPLNEKGVPILKWPKLWINT